VQTKRGVGEPDDRPAAAATLTGTGGLAERLGSILRPITIRGVAGVLAGLLVGGVGGRLIMRISAIAAAPDATGLLTENGNRIGEITVEGTLALLVFVGIFTGISGGIILALLSPWLPRARWASGLVFGAFLFAVAGTQALDGSNRDFFILPPPLLNVLLFSALFPLYGFTAVYLADRTERRPPRQRVGWRLIAYTPALALGALFLIPTVGSFFSRRLCFCNDPPVATGAFLMVVASATAWTWIQGLRGRAKGPTAAVRSLAYAGLAGATVTGALTMVQEISAIL
jgi:hypothetical protein